TGQEFVNTLGPQLPWNVVESPKKIQVLARGKARKKRPLRRNRETNSLPNSERIGLCIETFDDHPAPVGQQHRGDELERGRLATAIGTEQHQHALQGNYERDMIEGARLTRALAAQPIAKRGPMAKDFADGFQYHRRHDEGTRMKVSVL